MEVADDFEMLVLVYQTTRHHFQRDRIIHIRASFIVSIPPQVFRNRGIDDWPNIAYVARMEHIIQRDRYRYAYFYRTI
jgi:hypothetical protein